MVIKLPIFFFFGFKGFFCYVCCSHFNGFFKGLSSALIIVHLLYNYHTLEHCSRNPVDCSENRAEFRSLECLSLHPTSLLVCSVDLSLCSVCLRCWQADGGKYDVIDVLSPC